jgi:hypothetical protein
MSFAKAAAEALLSNEADAERTEEQGRWKKYLAAGLGAAGLGVGGYMAYKNWDTLAPAIDKALGGTPASGARYLKGILGGGSAGLAHSALSRRSGTGKVENLANLSRLAGGEHPVKHLITRLDTEMNPKPGKGEKSPGVRSLHDFLDPEALKSDGVTATRLDRLTGGLSTGTLIKALGTSSQLQARARTTTGLDHNTLAQRLTAMKQTVTHQGRSVPALKRVGIGATLGLGAQYLTNAYMGQ